MKLALNATLLLVLIGFVPCARADVKLARLFADHMVLQRGAPLKVWGWADPGENVSVSIGNQAESSITDRDGKWSVKLAPLQVEDPLTMTVQGNNKLTIQDVLVGDVWVASGQSNMGFALRDASTGQEAIAG